MKELAFRDSWVFVGAKGIENKSPFEQVCACARLKGQNSSALCDTDFPTGAVKMTIKKSNGHICFLSYYTVRS